MGIETSVDCDGVGPGMGCGERLSIDGVATEALIVRVVLDAGWSIVSGKYFCPSCSAKDAAPCEGDRWS